jgi:PGF-CTERM protein
VVEHEFTRRRFIGLSATAAGALLAGRGRAVQAADLTARYEFLVGHVEPDFAIPTLVRVTDTSGFDSLDEVGVEYRTRADEPAAYARLTPEQAETVAGNGATDLLEYAPGANPFWKLGAYEDGVFPDPADSVDFIAHEETLAGLSHLESAHPDRLRVETFGNGHGQENLATGQEESRAVWLAELTDTVGDAEDRETVVFSLSVHGDERAGVEAGLRFLESVLTGDRPEIAALLSEVRLVFVCPNPDGWLVRQQVYEDPVDPPDFTRVNGASRDLNREQPTAGWILPGRLPGEPRGANLADDTPGAVDDDVPDQVAAAVPETLALVERLRSYERVDYLLDLHGMYGKTEAVLALESGGGRPGDRADTDLLTRAVERRLREAVGPLADWTDAFEEAIADTDDQVAGPDDCRFEQLCRMPVQLFGAGTGLDTINYTVSGGLDIWADLPERVGGLGATSLTLEVVFSNSLREGMERRFMPDVLAFQVGAYGAVCDAAARHAADETGVTVETGGRSTAYLASEKLTRRATDLPHVDEGATPAGTAVGSGPTAPASGGVDSTLAVDSREFATGQVTTTIEVPESTHTLTVEVRAAGNRVVEARLRDGDGATVAHTAGPADGDPVGRGTLTAVDPGAGTWQVTASAGTGPVEVRTTRLVADGIPDPMDVLGYGQREYEVTPLAVFDALDSVADATVEAVTADTLRAGELVADGVPAYDNVVVTHSHGVDADALSGLAAYVEAGGNLVLTDAGLTLAAELDVAGLTGVDSDSIAREERLAAAYPDTAGEHPLVDGQRTVPDGSNIDPREPWTHSPMGYARDEVPVYTVAEGPLREAGASVGSVVDGRVRLATVPTERERVGVHLLGSLLPPASQNNLHPFGLLEHSLTRLGYLLLCNALGYRLSFSRNGNPVRTFGSIVDIEYDPDGDGTDGDGGGNDGGDGSGGDGSDDDGSGGDGSDDDGSGGDGSDDDGSSGDGSDDDGSGGDGSDDDGSGGDGSDDDGSDGDGGGDGLDGDGGDPPADDSAGRGDGGDGSGPGFGVAAGVAGLGGLGYLLSRRMGETGSETD